LSSSELKTATWKLVKDLRELQMRYDLARLNINKIFTARQYYSFEYRIKFWSRAISLVSELLSRLGNVPVRSSSSLTRGAQVCLSGIFIGPSPISDVSDYLDFLQTQIPQ